MRLICLLASLVLLASGAVAQSAEPESVWTRPVNLYATVASEDGYVNLRYSPTSQEDNIQGRAENGERLLVVACQDRARGGRWCDVRREGSGADTAQPTYTIAVAYDAELVYEAPGTASAYSAAGSGVAEGFDGTADSGWVDSEDGYLNLRALPSSSSGRVLRRLPNDTELLTVACQRGRETGRRWCMVEVMYPRSTASDAEMGYVYDAEIGYNDDDHHH